MKRKIFKFFLLTYKFSLEEIYKNEKDFSRLFKMGNCDIFSPFGSQLYFQRYHLGTFISVAISLDRLYINLSSFIILKFDSKIYGPSFPHFLSCNSITALIETKI